MAATLDPTRVEIGIQLPIQAQSTAFVEPWEADAGASELAAIARACDDAGFGYVAVCDHVAVPVDKAEVMGSEWWDTVATLGWLAGITERVRLVSHVAVPAYRHPLAMAKAFATLDAVSGGRAVMGVGAGHVEGEFDALGRAVRRPGCAARRGHRRPAGLLRRRGARATTAPTGRSAAWPSSPVRCRPAARRSGSVARRPPPSAGPAPGATAGCRRDR